MWTMVQIQLFNWSSDNLSNDYVVIYVVFQSNICVHRTKCRIYYCNIAHLSKMSQIFHVMWPVKIRMAILKVYSYIWTWLKQCQHPVENKMMNLEDYMILEQISIISATYPDFLPDASAIRFYTYNKLAWKQQHTKSYSELFKRYLGWNDTDLRS